ncbi:MAG: T9SS type A sorting domain-containing protein, partial [Bacteroidia bacterium]|nr:T9SS type A sorting domain-containing protein [Bacteroidia bacterium]
DFMIMGSPMTAETRNGVFVNSYNVQEYTSANFLPHPGVPAGGTNFADDNLDDWNPASGAINPGEGYLVYPQAAYNDPLYDGPPPVTTLTFPLTYTQGTLNNGTISRSVLYNGGTNPDGTPNILSNPYASPIDAGVLIANNALINEVYFWEHLTPPSAGIPGANTINVSMDDISMYNGTMGVPAANDTGTSTTPNGVISTGQGFGIKAFGSGTVNFTNSMRLTSGNSTLRTSQEEAEKLILKVANDGYDLRSYTGIGFRSDGTPELDDNMDSNRLATLISLYSHLEDGSEQLGIQTRESFESGIKIPMGFASQVEEAALFEISIAGLEGNALTTASIYLIDNVENTITDLTQSNYQFSSTKGTFNGRFTLQFEGDILSTNDLALETIGVYPNPTSGQLNIVSPTIGIEMITVYDLRGRKVEEVSLNGEQSYQVDMSAMDAALYFVTIQTENGSVTKRIVKK